MEGSNEDAFRLLRLCLLRPPPAWIELPCRSRCSVEVEIAVGVTDDYGVHFDAYETLNLSIAVVDSATGLPTPSIRVELKPRDLSTGFSISSSRGQFHTLKPNLIFDRTLATLPSAIQFVIFKATDTLDPLPTLSEASSRMLDLVGESTQVPFESWDENRYVFMRVSSGDVEIKTLKAMSKGKGKAEEPRLASTKLQTALRQLHLPHTFPSSPPPLISIIERPGLNNSTGQRLWDCAVGLSCYLSLHPSALHSPSPTSHASDDGRPSKRARLDKEPSSTRSTPPLGLRVLELGAGCALVGIVAGIILASGNDLDAARVEIVVSDVQVTVDTTLAENLAHNLPRPLPTTPSNSLSPPPSYIPIRAKVLDWGDLGDEQKDRLWTSQDDTPCHLTLFGSDILYNPSSHQLLLQTLLSFLRNSPSTTAHALIAYKGRTAGDDQLFQLARDSGLEVKKVWEWGVIAVYEFRAGGSGGVI